MTRHVARAIATGMLAAGLLLAVPGQALAAHSFPTCKAMHKVYPHGVGKPAAYDFTYGTPVTNFKHSVALYRANKGLDHDHDGIACEHR